MFFLYETPIKALQSEEFHISLWPGAIPRSGHAGYTINFISWLWIYCYLPMNGFEPIVAASGGGERIVN